jgi:antitoxin ParD1/3/4
MLKMELMMNVNVSLPDELAHFVTNKVENGQYASLSEVVQDALRLMAQHDSSEVEKRTWLQNAWQEGLESGSAGEIDFTALKQEARAKFLTKA